jgi:predicted acyl esterase
MSAPRSTPGPLLTGEFRDGPFAGLGYRTPSVEGATDDEGNFRYQAGEPVTFFIGRLVIGTAAGSPHLTLASLHSSGAAGEQDLTLPETVNRARFVQSLARERDLRHGVSIDKKVRDIVSAHADGIWFDRDMESFENAAPVRAVFSELGLRLRGAAEARNHLRRSLAGIKALRDERIPTRDGSYLEADVFRPNDAGSYPVLLRLGVYGRAFEMGSIFSDADYDASEEREAAWYETNREQISPYFRPAENAVSANASTWVPRGYVLVRVDSRGVGNTPGKLNPFSKQEALDYYDAIEWAAKQPWCDGNVGLYGASYAATIQWNVAALRPPHLKAIAPLASDGDAYRELAYPGGIFMEKYRQWWWSETVGKARGQGAAAVDFVGGLASHPWDDEYYQGEGILSADFARIDIPVLTAVSQTGWIHGRAGFEAFSQLPSPPKQLLVLDAAYMSYVYEDCQPDLEAFFDRFLKGTEPAREPSPVRMVMRTGDGGFEWRNATTWPVPGTEYRELFLGAPGASSPGRITSAPAPRTGYGEYSADVHNSAPELPMAVFESAPLDEDIELAGHFRATLWVASTSSDADLFVALRVMDGDREVPYQTRDPEPGAPLTWGCLKVSHRALDPVRTTTERPWHTHRRADAEALLPGEVVKAEVEMMPATGRIPAGRRLRIEISPAEGRGAVPGFERDYDESYHRGAVNRIATGGPYPSSITIPVVPRQPS